MTRRSVLGGTLIATGANTWEWIDGTPEPRVTDLSPSQHYNFRCLAVGSGETYVEVLLSAAHKERDMLGWVLTGVESGIYLQTPSGDHLGPRVVTDTGMERMRIEPGEDPLHGNEPIIHKRSVPRVALVPISDWDTWSADHPYGATWDSQHQDDIFAKARTLGWRG